MQWRDVYVKYLMSFSEAEYFPNPGLMDYLSHINFTDNYRGITLLSVLGKLFTRIMNNRLVTWAEEYRIYVKAQGGFRPGRSTVDNIFVLDGIMNSYLSSGKALYSAFIDFSKAFDYVVRDNLWYKLIKAGVSGKMLTMIRSISEHVKTKVFFQGNKSDEFECSLGVRQGDCLSPSLFAMYINDLEHVLISNQCGIEFGQYKMSLMLYADDVILLSDKSAGLQKALDVMQNYSNRWKLKINTNKSKILVFKKGRRRANERWIYGNAELQQTNSIPYLGIVFTQGGAMTTAQKTLSEQALKATFDLQKKISNFDYINPPELKDLFYKMVVPILNYSAEVWGFHLGVDVERVHLKFLKNLLGVKRSTQNDFIYGEYGTTPLNEIRKIQILKYWARIVSNEKSGMVTNCYNVMYNHSLITENCTNWASRVSDLLFSLGFGECWFQQSVGDIQAFISIADQRIKDQYLQQWHGNLESSTRARTYRALRPNFTCQTYLHCIHSSEHLKSLARFVTSSHRLRVETGRWDKPPVPYAQRKCQICDIEIEDEFHFMFVCPLYNADRTKLLPRYYRVNPSMQKFIDLMNETNPRLINRTAKFIYKSFKSRTAYFSQHWFWCVCVYHKCII